MTEGNLSKQILFFSIPLMISNLLQALFNMADIAVVGQFSGAIALGAVGSTVITRRGIYRNFDWNGKRCKCNLRAASRGIGKTVVPMIIVILGSCIFRIVWVCTIFAYFKTITSLYLIYIFSWSITAAAEIIYFMISYQKLPRTNPGAAIWQTEPKKIQLRKE